MDYGDEQIIQMVNAGDREAYKYLVDRYADSILNFCYRYLYSREEAEDATQDVFLKAYQALPNWQPKAQFKTWLYRIAINHCLNLVRRRKKVQFTGFENQHPTVEKTENPEPVDKTRAFDEVMIADQERASIRRAVDQLPENQRQVIILFHFQDLSYKEIAQVLNLSINSVESRIFRAKKTLAKTLKREKK